jgi:hypothetical protein
VDGKFTIHVGKSRSLGESANEDPYPHEQTY